MESQEQLSTDTSWSKLIRSRIKILQFYLKPLEGNWEKFFTAYFDVIAHTNYFDDDLSTIFGKDKEVWIEKLQALHKKKYKHVKQSWKQLESQLISVYGTKSVFSF